jgi:hypothetical protein
LVTFAIHLTSNLSPFISHITAISFLCRVKDDEKIKDDWIGSVGRAIVRCSSTYVSRNKQGGGGGGNGGGGGGQAGLSNDAYEDDSDDYSNSSNNPYFND